MILECTGPVHIWLMYRNHSDFTLMQVAQRKLELFSRSLQQEYEDNLIS